MRYVGIDPGAYSAIALMSENKIEEVISIDLRKVKGQGNKLHTYMTRLRGILDTFNPEAIYCEEPFIKFMNAAKSMNKLLGVIELTAYMYNKDLKIGFINPSVVKKTITGNGRAEKIDLANALIPLVTNPEVVKVLIGQKKFDETDSIAITLAGYRTGGI